MTAMRRKIRQYFAAGSRMVWVIDPENRQADGCLKEEWSA
jgi:Uma2 family endonuclease